MLILFILDITNFETDLRELGESVLQSRKFVDMNAAKNFQLKFAWYLIVIKYLVYVLLVQLKILQNVELFQKVIQLFFTTLS